MYVLFVAVSALNFWAEKTLYAHAVGTEVPDGGRRSRCVVSCERRTAPIRTRKSLTLAAQNGRDVHVAREKVSLQ